MKLRLRPSENERDALLLEAVELSDGSEIPGPNANELVRRRDGTVFRSDMATLVLQEQILLELRALRKLLKGQPGETSSVISDLLGALEGLGQIGPDGCCFCPTGFGARVGEGHIDRCARARAAIDKATEEVTKSLE